MPRFKAERSIVRLHSSPVAATPIVALACVSGWRPVEEGEGKKKGVAEDEEGGQGGGSKEVKKRISFPPEVIPGTSGEAMSSRAIMRRDRVVSVSQGGVITLWDLETMSCAASTDAGESATCACVSGDGGAIAVGVDSGVLILSSADLSIGHRIAYRPER